MAGRKNQRQVVQSEEATAGQIQVTKVEKYTTPLPQPVEAAETGEPDDVYSDPLMSFATIVEPTDQCTLRIWRLPNYEVDRRTSPHGTNREFCGSLPYSPEDDTILNQVQERVPSGGWVLLELIQAGQFVQNEAGMPSRGVIKVATTTTSTQQSTVNSQQSGTTVIQVPGQPSVIQPQQLNPRDMLREQMNFMRDFVEVSKTMLPPPQPQIDINNNPQFVEVQARVAVMDKIIGLAGTNQSLAEKLLGKFIGGDEPPVDSGTSWVGLLTELVKGLPSIIESIARYAPMMQARGNGASGVQVATIGGTATGAALPPAPLNSQQPQPQQQQPAQQLDPITQRWQNVVRRLVEDLLNDTSVDASVNAIADLYEQVPETREVIKGLMSAKPEELLVMCARITATSQEEYVSISSLTRHRASINWVVELQAGARETLESMETESEPELELEEKESEG